MTILQLVEQTINDKSNTLFKLELGEFNEIEINLIFEKTGFKLNGYKRIIDSYGIKHTLKKHGNEKQEFLRGQIPIINSDFEFIPLIISKPDNIQNVDKNRIGNDLFLYSKQIENIIIFYVEGIRANKNGRKEAFLETMYKRKAPKN